MIHYTVTISIGGVGLECINGTVIVGICWRSNTTDFGQVVDTIVVRIGIKRISTQQTFVVITQAIVIVVSIRVITYAIAICIDSFIRIKRKCILEIWHTIIIVVSIGIVTDTIAISIY